MFGHMTPTHVFRAQPKVKKKKKKSERAKCGALSECNKFNIKSIRRHQVGV